MVVPGTIVLSPRMERDNDASWMITISQSYDIRSLSKIEMKIGLIRLEIMARFHDGSVVISI